MSRGPAALAEIARVERPGPLRTCVGCGRVRSQHDLVRVVASGAALVTGRRLAGRGAWLCVETAVECAIAARRRHRWSRALRRPVSDDAATALEDDLRRRVEVAPSVRGDPG